MPPMTAPKFGGLLNKTSQSCAGCPQITAPPNSQRNHGGRNNTSDTASPERLFVVNRLRAISSRPACSRTLRMSHEEERVNGARTRNNLNALLLIGSIRLLAPQLAAGMRFAALRPAAILGIVCGCGNRSQSRPTTTLAPQLPVADTTVGLRPPRRRRTPP